jgi:hypothetical protein
MKRRKESIMPGGDGSGPMGMGPMTGRAAGYCAGYAVPGYASAMPGRGFGRGMGFGRGLGRGRGWRGAYGVGYGWAGPRPVPVLGGPVAPAPASELDALKGQAEHLAAVLEDVKGRITEIESSQERKA